MEVAPFSGHNPLTGEGEFCVTTESISESATFAQDPKQPLYGGLFFDGVEKGNEQVYAACGGVVCQVVVGCAMWAGLCTLNDHYTVFKTPIGDWTPRILSDSLSYELFLLVYSLAWLRPAGHRLGLLKLGLYTGYGVVVRPLSLIYWASTDPDEWISWYTIQIPHATLYALLMVCVCFGLQPQSDDTAFHNSLGTVFPVVTFYIIEGAAASLTYEVIPHGDIYHFIAAATLCLLSFVQLTTCSYILSRAPGVALEYVVPLSILSSPAIFIYNLVVSLLPVKYMLAFVGAKLVLSVLWHHFFAWNMWPQNPDSHAAFHHSFLLDYGTLVTVLQVVNVATAFSMYSVVRGDTPGDWSVWVAVMVLALETIPSYVIGVKSVLRRKQNPHYAFSILSTRSLKHHLFVSCGVLISPVACWAIAEKLLSDYHGHSPP